MTFEELYQQVKNYEGWMGYEDCSVLWNYASKIQNGLILEIGSYGGISTLMLAHASPTSKVIAIDPYEGIEWVKQNFLKRVSGLNIELINEKSNIVGNKWDKPIDLLHIDGAHDYDSVLSDITQFYPFVKKDGVILLHDIEVASFGVSKALIKYLSEFGFGVLKK